MDFNDGWFYPRALAGEDQEGADDWMWGAPLGLSGDPSYAASGVNVWGNDLAVATTMGRIAGDKWNRLTARRCRSL